METEPSNNLPITRQILLFIRCLANALVGLIVLLQQIVFGRQHVIVPCAIILVILQINLEYGFWQRYIDVFSLLAMVMVMLIANYMIILASRNQLLQHRCVHICCCFVADRIG